MRAQITPEMPAREMQTFRVGPDDFPVWREIRAYRVTFPAGHYLGHPETSGLPNVEYWTTPYQPRSNCPEALDSQVTCEEVRVLHTEHLNGGPNQPTLIEATTQRVLNALQTEKDIREL